MVEPLREEAKAFFGDDMLLQDFFDAKKRRGPCGDGCGALFFDIFDYADEVLLDGKGGEEEEEEEKLEWLDNKDAFPGLETSFDGAAEAEAEAKAPVLGASAAAAARIPVKPRSKGRRRRSTAVAVAVAGSRRRCRHCASEDTPQWRAGPDGPKTLCNACGVRFKSGRLVPEYRPARSPTFISALHSNSHRRILQMRRLRSPSTAAAPRGGRGRRRRVGSVVLESPLPNPIC